MNDDELADLLHRAACDHEPDSHRLRARLDAATALAGSGPVRVGWQRRPRSAVPMPAVLFAAVAAVVAIVTVVSQAGAVETLLGRRQQPVAVSGGLQTAAVSPTRSGPWSTAPATTSPAVVPPNGDVPTPGGHVAAPGHGPCNWRRIGLDHVDDLLDHLLDGLLDHLCHL